MSEVASLELSTRLYELSGWGWKDSSNYWCYKKDGKYTNGQAHHSWVIQQHATRKEYNSIPAYSSGYLLRKLPALFVYEDVAYNIFIEKIDGDAIVVKAISHLDLNMVKWQFYGEPEDALAKMCIKLFENGILKKGEA